MVQDVSTIRSYVLFFLFDLTQTYPAKAGFNILTFSPS